jgi:hypothetical protein
MAQVQADRMNMGGNMNGGMNGNNMQASMRQSDTAGRQPAVSVATPVAPPMHEQIPMARRDVELMESDVEDDYTLEPIRQMGQTNPTGIVPDTHTSLPVPEPEEQALQRPSPVQRSIRRVDRNASDLPRSTNNNRNTPSNDVIDIPAFLRKR